MPLSPSVAVVTASVDAGEALLETRVELTSRGDRFPWTLWHAEGNSTGRLVIFQTGPGPMHRFRTPRDGPPVAGPGSFRRHPRLAPAWPQAQPEIVRPAAQSHRGNRGRPQRGWARSLSRPTKRVGPPKKAWIGRLSKRNSPPSTLPCWALQRPLRCSFSSRPSSPAHRCWRCRATHCLLRGRCPTQWSSSRSQGWTRCFGFPPHPTTPASQTWAEALRQSCPGKFSSEEAAGMNPGRPIAACLSASSLRIHRSSPDLGSVVRWHLKDQQGARRHQCREDE